jgi:hypothetical protein
LHNSKNAEGTPCFPGHQKEIEEEINKETDEN